MSSIACVVTAYQIPKRLVENYIIANDFQNQDVRLYIVVKKGDIIPAPPHITVIEIPKQKIFNIGKTANVGIRRAIFDGADIILKTDIDNVISAGVFEQIKQTTVKKGFCYRNWNIASLRDLDNPILDPKTMGSICLHKDTWNALRGYNELLEGYGYDDAHIFKRALISGLDIKVFFDPIMYHITHASGEKHNINTINPLKRKENLKASKTNWLDCVEPEKWGII